MLNQKSLPRIKNLAAFKTAIIYAFVGTLWIILSDTLLTDLLKVPETIGFGQTVKGLAFVLLTSLLVYFLVNKYVKDIISTKELFDRSEDHFAVALNAANMATWKYYPSIKKLVVDPKFLTIHEIDPARFDENPATVLEKIFNTDKKEFENLLKEFNQKRNVTAEYRIVDKSGHVRWIYLNGKFIKEGKVKSIIGIARDISINKLRELEVKQSEERLSIALEITNDALWDWDSTTGALYISPRCYSMLGYAPSEINLTLELLFSFIHPDDSYIFKDISNKKPEEVFVYNYLEYRIKTKSGHYIWVINRLKVIERNKSGKPERVMGTLSDITERKHAQTELIERNEFIETILENLPIGLTVSNVNDGKLQYVNKKMQEIYGWSIDSVSDTLTYNDIFQNTENYETLIDLKNNSTHASVWNDLHISRPDGTERILSVKNIPLLKQDMVISSIIDVTDESIIKAKLNTSEVKFKTIFNEADVPMAIIDGNGKILEANDSAQRLFHYSSSEFQNLKSIAEIIFPADIPSSIFWFQKLISGELKNTPLTEKRFVTKNGELIWAKYNSSAIRDSENKFIYSISVIEDITSAKKAEDESRKLFKAVEQSPSSLLITDKAGNIEYVNPSYLNNSGYERNEILGNSLLDILFPGSPNSFHAEIFNAITNGKEYKCDYSRVQKNNKMIWELITISPIKDKAGDVDHMLVIIENITDRKEFESSLISAKEDAEKADKLKLDFLTQMSHEIRTPLNSIISYLSLVHDSIGDSISEKNASYFDTINNSSKRLIRTIELILNMSEILNNNYKTDFKNIDLQKEVVENLLEKMRQSADKKGLKLVCTNESESTIIFADLNSIKQAFSNLIDNAIKYSDKGGVKIRFYNNEKNKLCVDIIDTGIGIANDYLPKLFIPFMQEEMGFSRVYEGNGLGLALVKKYLDLNNAVISVTSEKGAGTTFTIVFMKS